MFSPGLKTLSVDAYGKGVRNLPTLYEKLGFSHILAKLYPEGRHEMLNETNRDETTDVIQWLNQQGSR